MGLLLGSNGLFCWFRNCPGYLLALLNDFPFLVSDGCSSPGMTSSLGWPRQGNVFSSLPSVAPPGSVVVSDVSWGPQKVKGFFSWVFCDAWGFVSNLMYDGGAVWNVATWHVLIEDIDGMTLGFPATFQFPWIFGFKNFSFYFTLIFLSFPAPSVCLSCFFLWLFWFCSGDFDLAPATNFSGLDCSAFQGMLLLRFFSDPFS